LFNAMAGVKIVRIPYKGAAPAFTDLISGRLQLMFPTAASVMPHVKSGRLKALAVTSAQPTTLVPGLPTVSATGLPGYESGWYLRHDGARQDPATIISQINQEVARSLNAADVKEKLFNTGVEVVASSPEQLAATMKSEMTRMGKVIKDAGIREE
jgi:tripartite-type tricarboxylate transporter receptor subunit TctC